MKSSLYQVPLEFSWNNSKIRKTFFLGEMDLVGRWSRLVDLIVLCYPTRRTGPPLIALEAMLRTDFLRQWFNSSDLAMEESFLDTSHCRAFVGLGSIVCLPDQIAIVCYRHPQEKHKLADKRLAEVNADLFERGLLLNEDSAVNATLIAAPSFSKNKDKTRCQNMHASQAGSRWHFGVNVQIGVDADSGLVRTVRCSHGNVHDITQTHRLLHGQETTVRADADHQGVEKRPAADPDVTWHVAMCPGKRKVLKHACQLGERLDKELKANICAMVEHPFRVLKRQFGYVKARYRGLKKNAAQITTLFALSNLRMAHQDLMATRA